MKNGNFINETNETGAIIFDCRYDKMIIRHPMSMSSHSQWMTAINRSKQISGLTICPELNHVGQDRKAVQKAKEILMNEIK